MEHGFCGLDTDLIILPCLIQKIRVPKNPYLTAFTVKPASLNNEITPFLPPK